MGIGTDAYPHNMLDEMRLVSYIGRVISESSRSVTVGDVFNAATLGGARALGRDDIGRLAIGCKADVVIADCTHPAMRPCHDPLRSLVYSASVFVDGVQVVRDQKVLTIDDEAASAALDEAQQRGLSRIRQLDWAGRSAEEIAGSAFPRR
jgi:5-methylthioadenosine/S-adenosylhomocysteine deaminase